MLLSQIWQRRKETRDAAPSVSGCWGGEERAEIVYPDVTPRHEKTPVGSLYFLAVTWCLEQTQALSLNAASRWSPRSYSYALLRDGGVWPHTCVPGVTERC